MSIRVGVLTVSDTAASNPSADVSGGVIKDHIANQGFTCNTSAIVRDDEEEIRKIVVDWSGTRALDLIITTGGTGFGVRDRTPEAIQPLIQRAAPGLVHLLLSSALQHTPFGALSRPVAGTIGTTLIVTLPGSPKAVREGLSCLFNGGVIQHAIDLVKGGGGQAVHLALGGADRPGSHSQPIASSDSTHSDSHHHHHHHHRPLKPRTVLSHDPSQPVSARHRVSPFPLIPLEDAISTVLEQVRSLEVVSLSVTHNLRDHVLAEDIFAKHDIPQTQTTNVDGYALRSSDPPGTYQVVTPLTHSLSQPLAPGSIYRINTGSPLPLGADAVIMVEDTNLVSTVGDEEKEVVTLTAVDPRENVRAPGSDVKKEEKVLESGRVLGSVGGEIGTLVFVGQKEVKVIRKPVIGLLSTGNEIVDLHAPRLQETEGWGGIWDTNRPTLQAALVGLGYKVIDLGVVADSVDAHLQAMHDGLARADLLLTTGGSSMGSSDLLKPLIERQLEGTIHFGRVSVKPGKPTTFATVPIGAVMKPVFALPGNPASALVTFYIFVLPALRKMGGWPIGRCQLPRLPVKITDSMRLDPRPEFHRVVIKATAQGIIAQSTGGQRSSRANSLSGANGLVALPAKKSGDKEQLKAGTTVQAILIGEMVVE